MKITDVRSIPVFAEARGLNYLFVRVETDDGLHGLGESGIAAKELAVQGVVEHFRPLLIGEDPRRTDFIWQRLFRGNFFKGGHLLSAAISAIDIALWDTRAIPDVIPVDRVIDLVCLIDRKSVV